MGAHNSTPEPYGWGNELGNAPTVKFRAQQVRRPLGQRIKRGLLIGLGSIVGLFIVLVVIGLIIGPQPPRNVASPAPSPIASTAPAAPAAPLVAQPVPVAPPAPIVAAPAAPAPTTTTAAVARPALGTPKPKPKPKPAPKPAAPAPAKAAPAPASSSGGSGLCVKKDKNGKWRDAKGRFCSPG